MFMVKGLSGTFGMLMGAIFTSRGQPKYCYLIFGIVGLTCSLCGMNLNSKCERDQNDQVNIIEEQDDQP